MNSKDNADYKKIEGSEETFVYWCTNCNTPIIKQTKNTVERCCKCREKLKYLAKDIRPVFPEERLLFEILTAVKPNIYVEKSVWCNNSTYYVDGESHKVSIKTLQGANVDDVRKQLDEHKANNTYIYWDKHIENFIEANKAHLNSMKYEAIHFIRQVMGKYADMPKYVSISGGKDSTVQSDLVLKATGKPSLLHIFCNTTLELPFTFEYIERLRKNNPKMVLKTVSNKEHDFYSVCDDIGVPSRSKRWCCTIFKTGIISKTLNSLFGDMRVLYFNGLRNSESNTRRDYSRITTRGQGQKIASQIAVSPIIKWMDIDIWLYILGEKIDFNDAYRLGFSRVGCFCCPNSSERNEFLAKIYMPVESTKWNNYLLGFAKKTGIKDVDIYVKDGFWKKKMVEMG